MSNIEPADAAPTPAAAAAPARSPGKSFPTKSAIALNGEAASDPKDFITFPVIPPIPDNIEVNPLPNVPKVLAMNPKEPLRRFPIPLSAPSPS